MLWFAAALGSVVLCVLSGFTSPRMIPDQRSVLISDKKIKIDSLSLNGLHTNTAATVRRASLYSTAHLYVVLYKYVSVLSADE